MLEKKIYEKRVQRLLEKIVTSRYPQSLEFETSFIYDAKNIIPKSALRGAKWKPLAKGQKWGDMWGSGWFKLSAKIPKEWKNEEVVALIDLDGEGCVYKNGQPDQGLTSSRGWHGTKRLYPLAKKAKGGEKIELLIEVAASNMYGSEEKKRVFHLVEAQLVTLDKEKWELEQDVRFLEDLMKKLPENSVRRAKILYGLNDVCNLWQDGSQAKVCRKITTALIKSPAEASQPTVHSIGHAHIDLAWLWPIRETKRKTVRTFATELKMIEEFPKYKFGASQPQQYKWVKEAQPQMFERIKAAVKAKQWELQGAMWCEPDTNVPSGESLIRQCLYGKRFFKEEFGKDVQNLWLPDVFGYSAALPQILLRCGVNMFMTQKISWNDTNSFPHHTFFWKGIDGSSIFTHFLPTNDYNFSNSPTKLIESSERYAHRDISNDFLNLYGIGDGGGGPGRKHIGFAERAENCEGLPKVKMGFAEDCFNELRKLPKEKLPVWVGELYLELHRGTYTTQGLVKRNNRFLERSLRDVEWLLSLAGNMDASTKMTLRQVWEDTLLNQFHDILPGSSMVLVYEDAHENAKKNLAILEELKTKTLTKLSGKGNETVVWNTQPWERTEVVQIKGKEYLVTVPPMGVASLDQASSEAPDALPKVTCTQKGNSVILENAFVKLKINSDGSISSLFDKELKREIVKEAGFVLWEDNPNNWDAWDVDQFYRETKAQFPTGVTLEVVENQHRASVLLGLEISKSKLEVSISLSAHSRLCEIAVEADWKESHRFLRYEVDSTIQSNEATFEIQNGILRRPTHQNTSWEKAKFEVCGHRFADLSEATHGLALINDCKYGWRALGSRLELSLLRSSKNPDATADMGIHQFKFALLPHDCNFVNSDVWREAHNFNSPLLIQSGVAAPKAPTSYQQVEGVGVKLETIKIAEEGDNTVLRLYETLGSEEAVTLRVREGWQEIWESDFIENKEKKLAGKGDEIELLFKAFQIRTFIIKK